MFARTPRLMLRPGWKEDAPALMAAIGDLAIAGKLARVPWPCRIENAEALIAADQASPARLLIFARTHRAPRLVGGIGLTRNDADVELSFWIARAYWGLGFATEAGQAVIELADEGLRLPRLVARHFTDNSASARVLHKLGFEPAGEAGARHGRVGDSIESIRDYVRFPGAIQRRPAPAAAGYDREDAIAA